MRYAHATRTAKGIGRWPRYANSAFHNYEVHKFFFYYLLPITYCLLPITYSLFPIPYSLFPVPCSL
ncbi:MAG: hypothetical protein F6K65_26510 [Moorea sp. SIO3C2]|nr:hypothetical protein [Moorena sp. SIO3C2]